MLEIEQFMKIQEYRKLGISKLKVSEILNLSYKTVGNWWERDEEYFYKFERDHELILDNYRQYLLEIIKVYPGIIYRRLLIHLRLTPRTVSFLMCLRRRNDVVELHKNIFASLTIFRVRFS